MGLTKGGIEGLIKEGSTFLVGIMEFEDVNLI